MLLKRITILKRKIQRKLFGVISVNTDKEKRGRVLFSYMTDPFVLQALPIVHTNYWEAETMVKAFLDRGYSVDIIDSTNTTWLPSQKYNYFFDVHQNIERLHSVINKDCVKIYHIVSAYWKYHNSAEQKRIDELLKRRGAKTKPWRRLPSSENIKYADYITILGNKFTAETYPKTEKEMFRIPISAAVTFPKPQKKWDKIRNNFIWFGGGGAVHKGLDLVLEAFSQMPEYNLSVCGPVYAEKDFEDFYHKELYETKNIKTFGRIDIAGDQFKEIADNCISLVYPSCSEGGGGSVVQCMHAGIIPIVSYESSVDIENFGTVLKNNSIEEIKNEVKRISKLPAEKLEEMSLSSWKYANEHHTKKTFSEKFEKFLDKIIPKNNK